MLAALSPFGPIFGKELRTAARRRRNYLLRVTYLGGLLLFLFLSWSTSRDFGSGGVAQRAQEQGDLGAAFFACFSLFCLGSMALVGPILTSTAINGERSARTLHVLLMTPLSAWEIVAGKLFSRMLTALTLIGLSLPVLALVRLLGGVELDQMFGVVCLCTTVALFGAALGLLLSILLRRAYAVILMSYLTFVLLYFIAPMLSAALLSQTQMMPKIGWFRLLATYNPFWTTGLLAFGQMRMVSVNWEVCVVIHLAAVTGLMILSAILLRRLARREGEGALSIPAPLISIRSAMGIAASGLSNDASDSTPQQTATRSHQNRTISDSPVLWRELRRPLMSRMWQRIAAVILIVGILFLVYLAAAMNSALDDHGMHAFLGCCFYTLMLLVVCVISATCIAQEKEGESWTVLLASPMTGREIVLGKAAGVLRRLMWPSVLVVAHFLLFTIFGYLDFSEFVIAVAVILGFNAIWVGTGVAISLRVRKVTLAVVANVALPILLYGVLSLILAILNAALLDNDALIRQVGWYLPYYYLIEGMQGSTERHIPSDGLVSPAAFAGLALFVATLYVLVAIAILLWTARRFDSVVGRARQLDPLTDFATAAPVG